MKTSFYFLFSIIQASFDLQDSQNVQSARLLMWTLSKIHMYPWIFMIQGIVSSTQCATVKKTYLYFLYTMRVLPKRVNRVPRRLDVNAMYISFHNLEERQLLTLS